MRLKAFRADGKAAKMGVMLFCVLMALLIILPLCYVMIVSVSTQSGVNRDLLSFLQDPRPENYAVAWRKGNLPQFGFNTLIVCALTVVLVVFTGSLLAYAIRVFAAKFKEVSLFYYLIMVGMFVPVQAVILPLFKVLKAMGLLNNLFSLALVYAGTNLPLSMMMFTGYYQSIPFDIIEAADIDGCGRLKSFYRIVFPLTKPVISTVTILVSLNVWRDFFLPLMLTTNVKTRTIAYGLMSFVNEFSLDWTTMCAAMVMATGPIVVLFLSLQKYFIGGVVAGAVKG